MSKVKIIGDTTTDKVLLEEKVLDLIKARLNAIKTELNEIEKDNSFFQKKYKLSTKEFLEKFNDGSLGDDEDFFVWEGSLNVKNKLLEEQRLLSELI